MKKTTIIGLLAVIAVLISVQMLVFSEPEPRYQIYKSYLLFDNITHMYESSELVIHGVIEACDTDSTYYSNVHTHFIINIKEVLKGNHTADTIVVMQDGGVYTGDGVYNGENVRVKDEPLMNVGEEVVLYLGYNPTAKSYVIRGGPQGRYLIKNGKIYHLTELDESIQLVTPVLHVKGADANNLRQILSQTQ